MKKPEIKVSQKFALDSIITIKLLYQDIILPWDLCEMIVLLHTIAIYTLKQLKHMDPMNI